MKVLTLVLAMLLLAAVALSAAPAGATFHLSASQGFDFSTGRVVTGGNEADLTFTYRVRRTGVISYLSAPKIESFRAIPAGLSPRQVEKWKGTVSTPSPGYYIIKSRSGRFYAVRLVSFEHPGNVAAKWKMSFDWQELVADAGSGTLVPRP